MRKVTSAIPILYIIILSFHSISFLDFFVRLFAAATAAVVVLATNLVRLKLCVRVPKLTVLSWSDQRTDYVLSIWLKMPLAIQFNVSKA